MEKDIDLAARLDNVTVVKFLANQVQAIISKR